jgi:hypothetical protein
MWIQLSDISANTQAKYGIAALAQNGRVLVEVVKGLYGLPHAGLLAKEQLTTLLSRHGYTESPATPGHFTHAHSPTQFTLIVDDFGVKTNSKANADMLLATLRELYEITVDWTGTKFLGLTLEWNYTSHPRHVRLSIPGYVSKALARFNVIIAATPTHTPGPYIPPDYGKHQQMAADADNSPLLTPAECAEYPEIVGVFLYYARAVDCTMLRKINQLARTQARPTEAVRTAMHHFLQYAATYPDAGITYYASDMLLYVHSDGSYLSEVAAGSRAGGFFFLSNHDPDDTPPINGSVLEISHMFHVKLSSAAEAEYGSAFINCQAAEPLRRTLHDMGYPQPATPVQSDNECAVGLANNTVKQKRSQAMDMRFHWIRDRIRQGHFRVYWKPGTDNLADFFTKTTQSSISVPCDISS